MRREKDIEQGREPRQIPEVPSGFEDWELSVEDAIMADRYGWTPEQIDTVDRHRVREWWTVKDTVEKAQRYLSDVNKGTENAMQNRGQWRHR